MRDSARRPQLDVLRGVAILLVLFRHGVDWHRAGHLRVVGWALESVGWSGVDLFFVLSGFLIGGLLFDEARATGRLGVKRFLIRRAFKLWPGYVVLLAVAIVAQAHEEQIGLAPAAYEFRANFVHLQNYFSSPQIHTWSLAVEEHFYLALPLVVAPLVARGRLARLPYVLVGCCVVCLALRIHDTREPFSTYEWFATHLRIDSLAFGVLLAYAQRARPELIERIARQRLILPLALALLSPALLLAVDSPRLITVGFSSVYIGYGLVIVYALYGTGEGWVHTRAARVLARIGVASYSIYLWHILAAVYPLTKLVVPQLEPVLAPELAWLAEMAIDFALAIGAGIVMAKLIEKPMLVLRDRLVPDRTLA